MSEKASMREGFVSKLTPEKVSSTRYHKTTRTNRKQMMR